MTDRMSYIFFYVRAMAAAREFYEDTLGLAVVEEDDHAVKYDCGNVLLALNVVAAEPDRNERSYTVFGVRDEERTLRTLRARGIDTDPDGAFFDLDRHRLAVRGTASGPDFAIVEVSLTVPDAAFARHFYGERLGLPTVDGDPLRYDAGRLVLSLRAGGDMPVPPRPMASWVFHAQDCEREAARLAGRGIDVSGVRASAIGRVAAFDDGHGNHFYLYEPSPQALSWPSGRAYRRIVGEPTMTGSTGEA